ncbi:MAG: hypothetical protein ACFB6R_06970 [Alphaproteobacteria bacterium]
MRVLPILAICMLIMIAPARADDAERDTAVMAVLDAFMETFNAQDIDAHLETYHFPHVRIAGGEVSVMPSADAYPRDLYEKRLIPSGWHHSAWIARDIVQAGPNKVHVATTFRRYREDGSTLATYQSLYIVEKLEGRWAVRARSSFAP